MQQFSFLMSFESQPENLNQKIVLEIQAELLRRAGCAPEDNEKCQKWIDAYAEAFRDIAESDPALLERWHSDREAVLQEVESRLYARKERESVA